MRGRPKLPARERQSEQVAVRMTTAERKALEQAAKKAGISLSNYLRQRIFRKPH
jgi:predicted HicB family RNase H-like nuclease